jgi:hypothetical protein
VGGKLHDNWDPVQCSSRPRTRLQRVTCSSKRLMLDCRPNPTARVQHLNHGISRIWLFVSPRPHRIIALSTPSSKSASRDKLLHAPTRSCDTPVQHVRVGAKGGVQYDGFDEQPWQ